MARRLLLGCSAVGNTLVERTRESRGELIAITDDTGWASTLRDRNVATVEADPTDPAAYPDSAAVVLVASDDPERNVAAAEAARRRYPDAMIVAHVGTNPTAAQQEALEAIADRVVDPVEAVVSRVREATGVEADEEPVRLLRALRNLSGPLLVVAHDNPDPDAIASALGLERIAEAVGVPADACYGGEIAHQENRAMVNLLDLSLRTFAGIDLDRQQARHTAPLEPAEEDPSPVSRVPDGHLDSRRSVRGHAVGRRHRFDDQIGNAGQIRDGFRGKPVLVVRTHERRLVGLDARHVEPDPARRLPDRVQFFHSKHVRRSTVDIGHLEPPVADGQLERGRVLVRRRRRHAGEQELRPVGSHEAKRVGGEPMSVGRSDDGRGLRDRGRRPRGSRTVASAGRERLAPRRLVGRFGPDGVLWRLGGRAR